MKKLIQHYALSQILGQGSFGKVYKATHTLTNQPFAIKVIPVSKFKQDPRLEICSANEIKNLTRIEAHPNIIRFIEMLKTSNNFYFVYEYCNGGTLEGKMKDGGKLKEEQAIKVFDQLLQAFKLLNKYNIMHRDLKPDNIFLHNDSIKLGDFGFCKTMLTHDDMTSTMLGSPIYMAPEVLRGQIYTSKADIWSLGVVLYEMIYGFCPFESNSIARLIAVLDKEEVRFPEDVEVSEESKRLMRRLLVKDQFKRMDWFELLTAGRVEKEKEDERGSGWVTQSLSGLEGERIKAGLKKVQGSWDGIKKTEEQAYESNLTKSVQTYHKSLAFNHSSPTKTHQQKALTFRKKPSDQNSNNHKSPGSSSKLAKATSLKYVPNTSPFTLPSHEPLQKLSPNVPTPPHQPRSNLISKRATLVNMHNACVRAMGTAINFMKSPSIDRNNNNMLVLVILKQISINLIKITDSISFGELELEDILMTVSQELRQIEKQIMELEKEGINQYDYEKVKDVLRREWSEERENKWLWYQMVCFIKGEEEMEMEGEWREENVWEKKIGEYLMIY